jgi:predicted cupin superfamily sugar epimerase
VGIAGAVGRSAVTTMTFSGVTESSALHSISVAEDQWHWLRRAHMTCLVILNGGQHQQFQHAVDFAYGVQYVVLRGRH